VKLLFVVLALLILTGCVTPISQSNLYWGNYSHTLYNVKKEPGEASNKAHEKELLSIVEKSNDRNLKVPPGVYAELGIFAKERGDLNASANYFRMEQDTYSEGSTLMQRVLSFNHGDS
jgi:hypothetical protein